MQLDTQFWTALLQIIGINIVLSGDNAVVIAMACRSLPPERQKWGVFLGSAAAIVLRIVFTVFIVYLLSVPYLKIVGGLLLLWIGFQLLVDNDEEDKIKAATSLWSAVRIVLVADAVMSLDNVIAVAAAANGNYTLLILGLVLSVPLVIYGATLLIKLLDRHPVIVPAGAALIGYIGGEVILTDPALRDRIGDNADWLYAAAPLAGAILVVLVGRVVAVARRAEPDAAGRSVAATPLGRITFVAAFAASVMGYAGGEMLAPKNATLITALDILLTARPIFAAVLAVTVGEVAVWSVRRLRRRAMRAV